MGPGGSARAAPLAARAGPRPLLRPHARLALAARLCRTPLPATVRFVFLPNEEPPFFASDRMGSHAYARAVASEEADFFYPDRGNFLGFVANLQSRLLLGPS